MEGHLCRFTSDGQFLVGFARQLRDLVVFRFTGLSFCTSGDGNGTASELCREPNQFSRWVRR